ncbi:class I SAM-dependent methyltransferase [Massilia niabensis]|uniref:Class I SAM-dependent methyltransferase n=1 Tax=Massilia niabensis TaxID=544910 RepID=A0ABW0L254_9BURK
MASESELVALQETLYRSSNPTRRWLHCTRRDWIIDALRRHAPARPARALEVGPGSCIYLPVLARLFAEVVATDIEAAFLKHAEPLRHSLPNLQLARDNICDSALPPASFDLILCTEVVEHIADSSAALRGMRRLLKPGGLLVLSTPQRYSPLEQAARIAFLPGVIALVRRIYKEPVLETGHINLMTARTVQRQLRDAGFALREQHQSGMYLPLLAEFGGAAALRLEQWLERKLRGTAGVGLLWTQYYVASAG